MILRSLVLFSVMNILASPMFAESLTENFCPVQNFKACGGELRGSWKFEASCPEGSEEPPCEFPFDQEPACQSPENTVHCQLKMEGTLTFYKKSARLQRTEVIDARYTFSPACTAAVRPEAGTAAERCQALSRPPRMTCVQQGDLCVCDSHITGEPMDSSAPYTAKKGSLKWDEFTATYCVADGQLTLNFDPHPQSWKYWVLTPIK